ncbi:prepilin-type N-terminal cleavage/methylation domain-containing protein, partial [Vibrio parahaemolyticus]|nr:prepilin-type N-terminal cleavage/methylation domain-containing protein [Vibrio parahaemolyticus]
MPRGFTLLELMIT